RMGGVATALAEASLDGHVALQDFDPCVVGALDECDMRAGSRGTGFLEDPYAFGAQFFDGGGEVLDDYAEVIIRVANWFTIAIGRLGRPGAADEQQHAIQSHADVDRSAGVLAT